MELSSEVYGLLERFKTPPEKLEKVQRYDTRVDDEIIPVEEIQFLDDETW